MYYIYKDKKLFYQTIGSGQAALFIHGRGCDHLLMKNAFEPIFQDKNYKRYYLDLPGMGKSDHPNGIYSSEAILEVLEGFVRDVILKDNDQFLILAQSYGAYLARGLLAKMSQKVAGMFLLCPGILAMKEDRTLPIYHEKTIDENFLKTLKQEEKEAYLPMAVQVNQETFDRWLSDIKVGLDSFDKRRLKEFIHNYSFTYDVDDIIKKLNYQGPVSFLMGRYDNVVGYQDAFTILDHYKRASFQVVDQAGHYLQFEQVSIFNQSVENWLSSFDF